MSKKDWQVGPVLKNKPGSQGTLFRGGTAYSGDDRYPRGYTPERRNEVSDAIQTRRLGGDWDSPEAHRGFAADRRNIVDTVSRSTVPVAHLSDLQWAGVKPGEHLDEEDKAAGIYLRNYDKSGGMIAVKPQHTRSEVPIHEIGHHVSVHQQENRHEYDQHGHSGAEEAFADNYAQEHFRDRRKRQTPTETYGGGEFRGHITRSDSFWDGYRKNRDYSLHHAENVKADADYYRRYPEEKVHPGNTVQDPLITKEWVSPDEKSTPEIGINEDALPERKWGIT